MLIIGGTTASGKSALAVELAKRLNGEVISADSMQIYKEMNIGTAKITAEEMQGIPHHLIDIVEPEDNFSVAEYADLAKKAISDIKNRGKLPIIVGGTGLYINALIYEYNLSAYSEEIRNALNEELSTYGGDYLFDKLSRLDPISAQKIHKNNVKRVIRALEVFQLTGNSLCEKQDKANFVPHKMYAIEFERAALYDRINTRVDDIFNRGIVGELEYLVNERKLSFDRQSMQAIGYKEFAEYFSGDSDLTLVKEAIKQHTRNYAKRQLTWFKSIPTCHWLKNEPIGAIADKICTDYYGN